MKIPKSANDHLIQQAIEGLTGFKCWSKDLPDYLNKIGDAELGWRLPFPWKTIRPVLVRPAVIPGLLKPGPKTELVKAVEESDTPVFVMDGMLHGKEALWLVYRYPDSSLRNVGEEVARWIAPQVSPMVIVGTYKAEATYIGAPLWSFVK